MVPVPVEYPREYSPTFWDLEPAEKLQLTCLMPNGILILLHVPYYATLAEIKEVRSQISFALA